MCAISSRRRTCMPGFTLVELLVVLGIIAVLVALLMPVLAGGRRHAQRVQCASNLRQIAAAIIAYGGDNRGRFPTSSRWHDTPQPSDWIRWRPTDNLDDSALGRYVGRPVNPSLFRCPADQDWAVRGPTLPMLGNRGSAPRYPFSYCLNNVLGAGEFSGRFSTVRDPSRTNLLGEVDERVMLDSTWVASGVWFPDGANLNGVIWIQLLSIRHDTPRRRPEQWQSSHFMPAGSHPDARGNVAYVDGHVDFTPRRVAHDLRSFAPDDPQFHWVGWAQ